MSTKAGPEFQCLGGYDENSNAFKNEARKFQCF